MVNDDADIRALRIIHLKKSYIIDYAIISMTASAKILIFTAKPICLLKMILELIS